MTRDLFAGTSGPHDARIVIVGESWGTAERVKSRPFVGVSGQELDKILAESNLSRDDIFCTNIVNEQPMNNDMWQFFYPTQEARKEDRTKLRGLYPKPNITEGLDRLREQLSIVRPEIVIGFGNYALWALTEDSFNITDSNKRKVPTGIAAWRGSQLYCTADMGGARLLPTFHPAAALRTWPWRYAIKHDLRRRLPKAFSRDWDEPKRDFILKPTLAQTTFFLHNLLFELEAGPVELSVDLETRAGHIACIGLAHATRRAICIPFMCAERIEGYWTADEEQKLIPILRRILTHPNARLIGQNFLYDAQYFALWWQIIVSCDHDTMLMHHVCWPGTPMGLGYLSSLYCFYHRNWKSEGKLGEDKDWGEDTPEEQLWNYNCLDAVITLEVAQEINKLIDILGLRSQADTQMQQFSVLLRVMLRGIKIDTRTRAEVTLELAETIALYEARFDLIIPEAVFPRSPKKKPWWRSPQQQSELFYDHLHIRATASRSMKDVDLERIGRMEPLLRPLTSALQEYRSLGVFHNTFCKARLDPDDRMRCSYNPTAKTFRYKSSKNAWNRGGNLQNLPSGREDD